MALFAKKMLTLQIILSTLFYYNDRNKWFMKKYIKWISMTVGTLVVLPFILILLFYIPPIQQWVLKQATYYASQKMGMQVQIRNVRLAFPLDLSMEQVCIMRPNDSLPHIKDTIMQAKCMVANVQLLPLFHQQVEVDELRLECVKLNTMNLIATARVEGTINQLFLVSHGVDLIQSNVCVNRATLADAKLQVILPDSVPEDTTKTKQIWKIKIGELALHHTDVTVHMPGDTIVMRAYMGNTVAKQGFFDLKAENYQVKQLVWQQGELDYNNKWKEKVKGFDAQHLSLKNMSIALSSFSYTQSKLKLQLQNSSFREQCGLQINKLSSYVQLDSTHIRINQLKLHTPSSSLVADIQLDFNAFAQQHPGVFNTQLHASFSKKDLQLLTQPLPPSLKKQMSNVPLVLDADVKGNLQHLKVQQLKLNWPTVLQMRAVGYAQNVNNINHLQAHFNLNFIAHNLTFVKQFLQKNTRSTFTIPRNIALKGNMTINRKQYASNFVMKQGGGVLHGNVSLDAIHKKYVAKLQAHNLALNHFLPRKGLHPFTGSIHASGQGFDILSPHTNLTAKVNIQQFRYGKYPLSSITANATIKHGHIKATLHSNNTLLKGNIKLTAFTTLPLRATIQTQLQHIDLHRLGITKDTATLALQCNLNLQSNLKMLHHIKGEIAKISLLDKQGLYMPAPIYVDLLMRNNSTSVAVYTDDLYMALLAKNGYQQLLSKTQSFVSLLQQQIYQKIINQTALKRHLPTAMIRLTAGKDNIFTNMMHRYGVDMDLAYLNINTSPKTGVNGNLQIEKLLVDSVQLDSVQLGILSTSKGTTYQGKILNNKDNPQYTFKALFNGKLLQKGISLHTQLYDNHNRLGLALGMRADMVEHGIRSKIDSTGIILGYKDFTVNNDNYLFLETNKRLSANIMMLAKDDTGVQLVSNDNNLDVLQDITISVNKIDLGQILSAIPYLPAISGKVNGDFHVIQTSKEVSVSSNVAVKDLVYKGVPMGNLSSEFVYMPKDNGVHFIDGILNKENQNIANISGVYNKNGDLQTVLKLKHFPLQLLNSFIPQSIVGLQGYGNGDISVKGSATKPKMNGEILLDSSYIESVPYGVKMRFADDPIKIVNSKIVFENFEMFANNNNPINVSGTFDFSNTNNISMNVRMKGENIELIDAKENVRSQIYGKAFVDVYGSMSGPVNNLKLRGKLNILGATDMTYLLKDNELSTDNQLNELVRFTDFNDSTKQVVQRPKLMGFNINMGINIDEAAHIVCMLNADHTNYIDLFGGGHLLMTYNTVDNLKLMGRYTLNSGEMKYSLPVIPLKTFHIKNGSYIEFMGNILNPKLNITATEDIKANVNESNGVGRMVDFDCGVKLTKTLSKPGIEFIIRSPNDITIQDQLNTMTIEGRGKVAITMLVSGMYLTGNNMAEFSMNNALSSYLQNEINNITGTAMRSMGLDLGMSINNTTTATGGIHTDYNFRFSKRLWNNRLRVIVGGKVSTGEEIMAQKDNNFFNKVEIEYRLNKNASQYLRLFYNNNTYDWLDGIIGEYGVGFSWRRKLSHFSDIFYFKRSPKSAQPVQLLPNDSIEK